MKNKCIQGHSNAIVVSETFLHSHNWDLKAWTRIKKTGTSVLASLFFIFVTIEKSLKIT